MKTKTLSLILLSTLLMAAYGPIVFAHNPGIPGNPNWPFPASYDATSAVVDTIGEPETLDPAWSYDTASSGVISNVYETLLFYDNVMTDGPYTAGKVDMFKPILATDIAVLRPTVFRTTYGGAGTDRAYSVVQTSDGGYAIAGETYSFGIGTPTYPNAYLVKTNALGTLQWSRTYGKSGSDSAHSLVQTSDGGFALAGFTDSYGAGGADFWLVKTDADGNHLWNKTYGGVNPDDAYSLVQTSDGGFALAGYTGSYGAGGYDFWLVKTDANGNELWKQTYGGAGADYAYSLVLTSDGGYALLGYSGTGIYHFLLVKTTADGTELWKKTYGGASSDYASSLVQTSDGGYAMAGSTYSYGAGGADFWLVKTDADGNHLWNKTYGGASGDYALSVVQARDGGYALAGYTASYGAGTNDFWLVKTGADGNESWNKTFGGASYDDAFSVIQTRDGGYALAGVTYSFGAGSGDFWLVKTSLYSQTFYFKIRGGGSGTPVYFHNGAALTPEDVEYSFERAFVQDRSGGPMWMLWYPTQGLYGALSPGEDSDFGAVIDDMVGSNATHAWISLKTDFPETTFLQILAQPWSSILNKAWCVAKGDFDGDFVGHTWLYIWDKWHNPATSFIKGAMMGTGPYKFDFWNPGTDWSIIKYDNYWDGWPARVERQPAASNERIGGFITRITWNLKTSWADRLARFLAGDADFTENPRQNRDDLLGHEVGGELIRCYYPVQPVVASEAFFFNFDINPESPYLGPGFDPANPLTIAEDRIPTNLFSDIHMRRGFRYAFDFATFLSSAYLGEATQPADPIIPGLSYDNPANAKPVFDWTQAVTELQAAWGGQIWANGMTFTLLFNSGNVPREKAVTILATNINLMNPKFHLSVQEVAWGSSYLPRMVARMLPLFTSSWIADYPDPDNSAFPFMHSVGTFSAWQGYSNPRVDALIEAGALMPADTAAYSGQLDQPDLASLIAVFNNYPNIPPDTRWPRRSIYYELQAIYIKDVSSVSIAQPVGRHWEQAWMRGWYFNPVYGGSFASAIDSAAPEAPVLYFYHLWKAVTHFGDANNDGVVNVVDHATLSASWTKPTPTSPIGPLGYKTQADLTGGTGGTIGSEVGLVLGIPDGRVTVVDAALVSAYWDGPPQGPQHP